MKAPRLRLHDAAMQLAIQMKFLAEQLHTDEARQNSFREVSALAIVALRDYLNVLSEATEIPSLSRPLMPLSQALLNLAETGATPKMFKMKAMSRPPATTHEMNLKYLCAWLQRLYRNSGLGRKASSKRLRGLLVNIYPEDKKVPSTRSLEDWFDKTSSEGPWHEEFSRIFSGEMLDTDRTASLKISGIDAIAKLTVAQTFRNF